MTDREQLEAYKSLRENGQAFFVDNYEDADRIIEALEKQIPKKPRIYETIDNEFIGCICPNCNDNFTSMEYCWNCGQAIDWSEVE